MRLVWLAACSFVIALVAGVGVAGAGTPSSTSILFRDAVLQSAPRALQLATPPGTSGGVYTTANGETVRVYAANDYLATDPTFNQRWADFLASAPHGAELSRVSLVLLPLAQVQSLCGAQALACYSPESETIVAPGEDPAPDMPAGDILLHEYGHHIAENRDNAPWPAVDYGPKRWASDESVCRQTENGYLHPGDESSDYRLNPGEAWAETYRVLAERALGLPSVPWTIVSSSFYPDGAALAAASADVLDPWAGNRTVTIAASFGRTQKQRRLRFATPYDGALGISLKNRTKSALSLLLVDEHGNALVTSSIRAGKTKKVASSICGQRSLQLRLSHTKTGVGSFVATISKP